MRTVIPVVPLPFSETFLKGTDLWCWLMCLFFSPIRTATRSIITLLFGVFFTIKVDSSYWEVLEEGICYSSFEKLVSCKGFTTVNQRWKLQCFPIQWRCWWQAQYCQSVITSVLSLQFRLYCLHKRHTKKKWEYTVRFELRWNSKQSDRTHSGPTK